MGLTSWIEWSLWVDDETRRRMQREMGEDAYYRSQAASVLSVVWMFAGWVAVIVVVPRVLDALGADPTGAISFFAMIGAIAVGLAVVGGVGYLRFGRRWRQVEDAVKEESRRGVV